MSLTVAVETPRQTAVAALLRLEVGIRNKAAEALYRRAGFTDRAPFGGYRASPISRFLEKPL